MAETSKEQSNGEVGVSGTINWSGRLHTEENSELQFEKAYGSPGVVTWGEWERLQRTDHAVSAALELVVSGIRDSELEVEAADPDDDASKLQAEFVQDNLTKWLEPQFSQFAESAIKSALGVGFSIHEEVYGTRQDARVPGGQAVYLKRLSQRLASSIDSDGWREKDGELETVLQTGNRSVDGRTQWYSRIELPASKLFLLSWNRSGNNYQGFSACRSIRYIAKIRADLLRIIGIGHQREAVGTPIAETDKDAPVTSEQLDKLQVYLENNLFHENAAIVPPKGVKVAWLYSPGANKGHVIETWRQLGLAILENFHVQQVFLGTGETGSRSVGEIHDATRMSFVNGVRAWFEANVNGVGDRPYTGFIRKLININFGPQESYPKLRLNPKKAETPIADWSASLKAMIDAGAITLTEEDEDDVRARLGMKATDKTGKTENQAEPINGQAPAVDATTDKVQDTALNGAQVTSLVGVVGAVAAGQLPRDSAVEIIVAAFQISREQADKILGSVGKGFEPEKTIERDATGKPRFGFSEFAPRRPLRLAEQHLALADMESFLNTARYEFQEKLKPLVVEMVRKASGQVSKAMEDGDPSELATLKLDSKRLEKPIEKFLEQARAFGKAQVEKERKKQPSELAIKRAEGSQELAPQPLDPKGLVDEFKPRTNQRTMKAQKSLVLRRIVSRTHSAIEQEAINAIQRGEEAEDVIKTVTADIEEGNQLRGDAGAVVTKTFNMGREEFAEEHGDEIAGVQYSAILDGRQCEPCNEEDGKEFEFESEEHLEHIPPYSECLGGNQCRCLLVYIFRK